MENKKMDAEEELFLASEDKLLEEADQIAKSTVEDDKFNFYLQYNANQKEYLLSILQTAGAIVEDDNEECYTLSTRMNMSQLAFIKQLCYVERVKTDEGINPLFLAEESEKDRQNGEVSDLSIENNAIQTEHTVAFMVDNATSATAAKADNISTVSTAIAEEQAQNSGVAVTSITASATSSCCHTNTSMTNAKEISDESCTSGCICCPGAEEWFKFTATRTGRYTIYTTGSLDTVGTLYDCCGNQIIEVDDYEPCGKLNFRIIVTLSAGAIYYIKVRTCGNDTGSYALRITERVLANYVTISKDQIILVKGVTYELPTTSNYTYKGYNGAQRIPGLSVSINPSNASEQKIWWYERHGNILEFSYDWDDDGDVYVHVTATENGTAELCAVDWEENGKCDDCAVTVETPYEKQLRILGGLFK